MTLSGKTYTVLQYGIRAVHEYRQQIWGFVYCYCVGTVIAPSLLWQLGLPVKQVYIRLLDPNCHVIISKHTTRKITFWYLSIDHIVLVDKPDILIVPVLDYKLIFGQSWFQSTKSETDLSQGRLLDLWTPVGNPWYHVSHTVLSKREHIADGEARIPTPPGKNIQILLMMTLDNLHTVIQFAVPFTIYIEECTKLL